MKQLHLLTFITLLQFGVVCGQQVGKPFPAWTTGVMDIHHINTGHGVSAFFIFPDGTTALVDAGELDPTDERTQGPRNAKMHPNDSKLAYEWIVDYIKQFHPAGTNATIDYALITHFHDDHYGIVHQRSPWSPSRRYRLSGVTGVGANIPFRTLIDRGYIYPFNMRSDSVAALAQKSGSTFRDEYETLRNLWAFEAEEAQRGLKVQQLVAGRDDQITLSTAGKKKFPMFRIVNLKCNGSIWTGEANKTLNWFPSGYVASENPLSLAIRVDYGAFRYYTGGDNPGIVDLDGSSFNDTETPLSKAIGEVDVAVMDHHGNRDSHNEYNVRTIRPRVWIQQVWSSDHPGHDVLRRVTSRYLYSGDRDLFATNMLEANRIVIGPLIDRSYKSTDGHIVVRVEEGGERYHVIILNDENESREVKAVFGPYKSKLVTGKANLEKR